MQKCKIKSIKLLGKRKTYNLTMKSDQHNYAVHDVKSGKSVISLNSHSACYGYNSYTTAYLKANYPEEFICSLMDVTINSSVGDKFDKEEAFIREFKRKLGIKFLSRDINKSKFSYFVERKKDVGIGIKKTEIRPSLLSKGVGAAAAKHIEEMQPYDNLREFTGKVDSSIVDSRVVDALAEGGYFGNKAKKNKESFVADFVTIRTDLKKVAKKGVESMDLFG